LKQIKIGNYTFSFEIREIPISRVDVWLNNAFYGYIQTSAKKELSCLDCSDLHRCAHKLAMTLTSQEILTAYIPNICTRFRSNRKVCTTCIRIKDGECSPSDTVDIRGCMFYKEDTQ